MAKSDYDLGYIQIIQREQTLYKNYDLKEKVNNKCKSVTQLNSHSIDNTIGEDINKVNQSSHNMKDSIDSDFNQRQESNESIDENLKKYYFSEEINGKKWFICLFDDNCAETETNESFIVSHIKQHLSEAIVPYNESEETEQYIEDIEDEDLRCYESLPTEESLASNGLELEDSYDQNNRRVLHLDLDQILYYAEEEEELNHECDETMAEDSTQNLSSEEYENISQTLNEDNDSTQSLQPMIVSSDEEIIAINTINISSVPELIEESDSGLQTKTTVEMTSNVRITYVIINNDKSSVF